MAFSNLHNNATFNYGVVFSILFDQKDSGKKAGSGGDRKFRSLFSVFDFFFFFLCFYLVLL